jgi:hypothetical protein
MGRSAGDRRALERREAPAALRRDDPPLGARLVEDRLVDERLVEERRDEDRLVAVPRSAGPSLADRRLLERRDGERVLEDRLLDDALPAPERPEEGRPPEDDPEDPPAGFARRELPPEVRRDEGEREGVAMGRIVPDRTHKAENEGGDTRTGRKTTNGTPKGPVQEEIRRRPTLPGDLSPSTIGAGGLNFRVRNGNGCDPTAMATEIYCQGRSRPA